MPKETREGEDELRRPAARPPGRRRGRPPLRRGEPATRERLLGAAATAFTERGFLGATLADIAERAGVTSGAIYNHFSGKEDLLIAASRAALESLSGGAPDPSEDPAEVAARTAKLFLTPEFQETRRLLIELHLAATRSPKVASLLSAWHREMAETWPGGVGGGAGDAAALTKFCFLLLMGLTHVDALSSLEVPTPALEAIVERVTRFLVSGAAT